MKIKIKKVVYIVIICIAFIIAMTPKSQSANLVIAFSQSTAQVGDTITVTVTGTGLSGTVKLSVSGNATLSQDTVSINNGSASVTATITGTGSIKIIAAPSQLTDTTTSQAYTESAGGTITVTDSSSTSTSTTTTTSTSADLSNLGITPNDFTGFLPEITTYDVTVPEDVESVEVYAVALYSGSTISGTGEQELELGENSFDVVVIATDGTTKTYTINVTRGEGEEEADGLSSITIGDLELSPTFSANVYEYTVNYIGEETSLDIQTVPTDSDYTVEIVGNEELVEGENTITILVTDSEGNNVATYQITVNKSLVDEDSLALEEAERQRQEQIKMFAIAGGIIAIIIIIIIIIIVKRRRSRSYAEDFSGIPFAGINEDDDYYDNYNDIYDNNYNNDYANNNYKQNDLFEKTEYIDDASSNENLQLENDNVKSLSDNEDIENDMPKQESNTKFDFDDSAEKREKERAKREFLKGYDSDYDSSYGDRPHKRRKGKRFK